VKKKYFGLAITGAFLIFISCIFEAATLIYAPRLNVGLARSPLEAFEPAFFLQLLLSLAGIVFTAKARHQFT
jgi:hypothetical protein